MARYRQMSGLDLLLLVLLALSAYAGYRRGAVLQAFGLTGLVLGVGLAALIASHAGSRVADTTMAAAIAVGIVLIGAAAGNVAGWLVGSSVKRRVERTRGRHVDAAGGAALSVGALVLATWFLTLNLISGPFPGLSSEIRSSRIVHLLDTTLPRPPALLSGVERAASLLGFPDAFAGVPPAPAEPVEAPTRAVSTEAIAAGAPSTVEVIADGCTAGYFSEGSAFVVSPGYVLTNAHVVAGASRISVSSMRPDRSYDAVPVLFDPDVDLALLRVPGLDAPPLVLAEEDMPRGTGGAVLGFPGGEWSPSDAAVRAVIDAVGHDIYGKGQVRRHLYELQASVHPGNSGGPFVLQDGRVAGIVFASSTQDVSAAYAIASTQVIPLVREARARIAPVSTGRCPA
jgi:S1-C subfamily serine protease